MKTAIIGLGNIGSTLARQLAATGHSVIVADRDESKARAAAAALGDGVRAASIADAMTAADIVVFAVWLDVIRAILAEQGAVLAGKIVVDPSNPIGPDGKGGFARTLPADRSSGQLLAGLLPSGARLVKAFGTLAAPSLAKAASRVPERAVGFYAADDDSAGDAVAALIDAVGFVPVKVGGIDQSIRIEVGGDLHEMGKLGRLVTAAEASALLAPSLSAEDRMTIFEQLHLHQHCIDNDASLASAKKYVDLFWEDATFTVHDLRQVTFQGPSGLKQLYDYAHSVFPLHKWRHSLGTFVIKGNATTATVEWRWIVSWKAEEKGTVSTGTYRDTFVKRGGVWKCLTRESTVDPELARRALPALRRRGRDHVPRFLTGSSG